MAWREDVTEARRTLDKCALTHEDTNVSVDSTLRHAEFLRKLSSGDRNLPPAHGLNNCQQTL